MSFAGLRSRSLDHFGASIGSSSGDQDWNHVRPLFFEKPQSRDSIPAHSPFWGAGNRVRSPMSVPLRNKPALTRSSSSQSVVYRGELCLQSWSIPAVPSCPRARADAGSPLLVPDLLKQVAHVPAFLDRDEFLELRLDAGGGEAGEHRSGPSLGDPFLQLVLHRRDGGVGEQDRIRRRHRKLHRPHGNEDARSLNT